MGQTHIQEIPIGIQLGLNIDNDGLCLLKIRTK